MGWGTSEAGNRLGLENLLIGGGGTWKEKYFTTGSNGNQGLGEPLSS